MGGWLSTFFDWNYWIFSQNRRRLPPAVDPSRDNTLLLLSAAAQLALLSNGMEVDNIDTPVAERERSPNDMKTSSSSDDSDGSELCYAAEQERERLFQLNQRIRSGDRFIVGNEKSYINLINHTSATCGENKSFYSVNRKRELGFANVDSYGDAQKVSLTNRFFPNSRKIIEKLNTKTFCVQHLEETGELISASQDERIRFYKPTGFNGRYERTKSYRLINVGWSILDVAFSPRGDTLAYGTWKDAVIFCKLSEPDVENPSGIQFNFLSLPPLDVAGASTAVFSIRFSHCGHEILAGSSDYSIHIFDLETQKRVITVPFAHADDVNAVCYANEDGFLIYSGGDDGLVKVWDRRCLGEGETRPVGFFAGHKDGITYIDSRGDSRYLVSNSKDQTIKLWDVRNFSTETAADETRKAVSIQNWDYRWQAAPRIIEKPLAGDSSVVTLRGHSVLHTLIRAKFSPASTGQRYIYSGCARGEIVVYDLISGRVEGRLGGHVAVVRDVSWHPSGNEIVSCAWDGATAAWKWDERKDGTTNEDDSTDEYYRPVVNRKVGLKKNARPKRKHLAASSNRRI